MTVKFELTTRSGDGLFIPCMAAIFMVRKLANGEIGDRGAKACIGIITSKHYLDSLSELDICWAEAMGK